MYLLSAKYWEESDKENISVPAFVEITVHWQEMDKTNPTMRALKERNTVLARERKSLHLD